MSKLEYINVRKKISDLQLNNINELGFLPYNFETAESVEDFIYDDSLKVVNKLWRSEDILAQRLETNTSNTKYYHENDITWIGPTIYVGYALWSENPNLISIGLSVVANYLTDFFKGKSKNPIIKLEYIIEQNPQNGSKNVRFSYEGDVAGMSKIPNILKTLKDE